MHALTIFVKFLCIIPFLTGAVDLLLGVSALGTTGVQLPTEALTDPSLNSQLRFFGAIWLGFGFMLWRSTGDLQANATWFRLMCFTLVLSGVGRLISLFQFGAPAVPFVVAIVVEIIVIPLVLLWHSRLMRKG